MEKYQDLIITLIQNHRRYPGCEGILDEIVAEVFKKASSVIDSVTDEEIVRKYIIKTISSAMIIVPKRYNINTRLEKKCTIPKPPIQPEEEAAQEESGYTNAKQSTSELAEYKETDTLCLEETNISDNTDENLININENVTEADNSESIENSSSEEIESDVVFSEDKQQTDKTYDKTLVDKMINGIADEEHQTYVEELELINNFNEAEIVILDENQQPYDSIAEDALLLDDEQEDLSELNKVAPLEALDYTVNEQDGEENTLEKSNEDNSAEKQFSLPDFTCFSSEVTEINYDTENVIQNINTFSTKYPNRQVKKILELKYSKCMSVEEIANKLNIEVAEVLETINDLIDIVEV